MALATAGQHLLDHIEPGRKPEQHPQRRATGRHRPFRQVLHVKVIGGDANSGQRSDPDQHRVDVAPPILRVVKPRDEEHDAQREHPHPLKNAQRTRIHIERELGIERVGQQPRADEKSSQIG